MKVFQNASAYGAYLRRLDELAGRTASFDRRIATFIEDRYASSHLLAPVVARDPDAFLAIGNDVRAQRGWARARGLSARTTLDDILLAQIEEHRPDVFYNLDPVRYGDAFVARLPGCVKHRIAWRAAPSPHENFRRYDLVVSNFPRLLHEYERRGLRTAYFFPAHDEVQDRYAAQEERPIDILFVGGYSRHHRRRAQVLNSVASLASRYRVRYHLDRSRVTRIAESPLGLLPPLRDLRRPATIRAVAGDGLFGRDLYEALGSAKIVLNAAIDMAGGERGNMRCFEAMGCGALLLSDEGSYPEGMEAGTTMVSYRDGDDAVAKATALLERDIAERARIADQGHRAVRTRYSRVRQWAAFTDLCARAA